MNRRSALGFLGIGAVAGPSVISQASESLVSSNAGSPFNDIYPPSEKALDYARYLKECEEQLVHINADPDKWIATKIQEEMRDHLWGCSAIRLDNIDHDIRNMKSFTDSAKIRMHIARRVKRQYDSHKESLVIRIKDYMGLMS